MAASGLLTFIVYAAVLAIVGVFLVLWVYPMLLTPRVLKPVSALTVLILVALVLLRLLGVVTWPV